MKQNSLRLQLLNLEKTELADLLLQSIKRHQNWKSTLLEKTTAMLIKTQPEDKLESLYQLQFDTCFATACHILDEHNTYGGGPEEDWDILDDALGSIEKMFKDGKLSPATKKIFFDEMMRFYDWHNSGLEDNIMDNLFNICTEKSNWEYLIKKLQAKADWYHNQLVKEIYRDYLHQEDVYLQLLEKTLQSPGDYLELAQYWLSKGNREKAIEIVYQGINKRDSIAYHEFLFSQYRSNDYDKAKYHLQQQFEQSPSLELYKELKKYVHIDEWNTIDQWCQKLVNNRHYTTLLADIHLINGKLKDVLTYVLDDRHNGYDGCLSDKERFAKELISRFPAELIPFYLERIEENISSKTRDGYNKAVVYVKLLKQIYIKELKQESKWQQWIDTIRNKYQKSPALLDEFKSL